MLSCETGSPERNKRLKMRDLESVMQSGEIRPSKLEPMACEQLSKEDGTSLTEEAAASMLTGRLEQATTGHNSLEQGASCPISVPACTVQSSPKRGFDDPAENNKDTRKSCLSRFPGKENDPPLIFMGNGMDRSTVEQNPFIPYSKLGQMKSADPSECGSTTGPLEMSEPLKMWNKMKQNGFLSLSESHGGIPIPRPRIRQRKRKENALKKKTEQQQRPHVSAFAKTAPPTGLLSGLDPGIIRHVRNSKQVYSIIEAMMRSEQTISSGQNGAGGKEVDDRRKDQTSVKNQFVKPSISSYFGGSKPSEAHIAERRVLNETSATSQFASEFAVNLSPDVAMGSDNPLRASGDGLSAKQGSITPLSMKAATAACQWLGLIQEDIRNRITALRRSEKRFRNAAQTEFPYLLSSELSSNQENVPRSGHSSGTWCSATNIHMAPWRSSFSEMDAYLYEEEKNLESSLRQVQEMQLHCEKGIGNVYPLSQFLLSDVARKSSKPDDSESAVMAAAASIYSTCNLVMTKEKMPRF